MAQPVLAPDNKRLAGTFGSIVINLKPTIEQEALEFLPLIQTVGNGLPRRVFGSMSLEIPRSHPLDSLSTGTLRTRQGNATATELLFLTVKRNAKDILFVDDMRNG